MDVVTVGAGGGDSRSAPVPRVSPSVTVSVVLSAGGSKSMYANAYSVSTRPLSASPV
ncbi:hypothetical protein HFP72_27380 [Nocardiopsis sp. ARC36]